MYESDTLCICIRKDWNFEQYSTEVHASVMNKDELQDSQLQVQTIMTRSSFIHKYNENI